MYAVATFVEFYNMKIKYFRPVHVMKCAGRLVL